MFEMIFLFESSTNENKNKLQSIQNLSWDDEIQ